jgi:chromosomal replication initiator protein
MQDPQVSKLQDAIAQRVGQQRFAVWFSNSARLEVKNDSLEIAVPNDFISEWIGLHFASPIKEATQEVLGCEMPLRFQVVPQLFDRVGGQDSAPANGSIKNGVHAKPDHRTDHRAVAVANHQARLNAPATAHALESRGMMKSPAPAPASVRFDSKKPVFGTIGPAISTPAVPNRNAEPDALNGHLGNGHSGIGSIVGKTKLRFSLESFVAGSSNQLAVSSIAHVAEFPGNQYNPLFLHASGGLGKTHLLHGLCRKFADHHPTGKWMYLTGEDFTNEFISALRANKVESFRRKMRELDMLILDDVHFLAGKRSTQEEFLHTFNALEATGKQVVLAAETHPKHVKEFSESLINRFVSGMVVRIDPPNFATRVEILRQLATRNRIALSAEIIEWIAKRVTQNIRELEGALTRIQAISRLDNRPPSMDVVRTALGDLDRALLAPLKPENILSSVCEFFGLEMKELMSGRRQRTISLARSVAMFLVRKNSRLSFPEIAGKLGKRNHSTVISACRRIEKAAARNEKLLWESSTGDRVDEAQELIQRLEEHARAM